MCGPYSSPPHEFLRSRSGIFCVSSLFMTFYVESIKTDETVVISLFFLSFLGCLHVTGSNFEIIFEKFFTPHQKFFTPFLDLCIMLT